MCIRDRIKLCRELDVTDPLVLGHSMGVQVNLQALRDGLSARGLVIIFGAAGRVLDQYGGNDRLGRYLPALRVALKSQRASLRSSGSTRCRRALASPSA